MALETVRRELRAFWEWHREGIVAGVLLVAIIGLIVLAAWRISLSPSCEELGGHLYQIGTREESYVQYTVKVGEISIPIYGTRTVAVYDCLGER